MTYIVYSGNGATTPGGAVGAITAAELATLYGLSGGEYETGIESGIKGTVYDSDHIHLIPRSDGRYLNIKNELGDNGTDVHYRTMVDPAKWKRENNDLDGNRTRR